MSGIIWMILVNEIIIYLVIGVNVIIIIFIVIRVTGIIGFFLGFFGIEEFEAIGTLEIFIIF